jgi:NhaP-type Na+/H+ or K+/H+ antiporter
MMVGKNTSTLGRLAGQINGKPTPEQMSVIQAARKTLSFAGPIGTVALVLALLLMATARYWVF